jgi:ureidoglycolate lyase
MTMETRTARAEIMTPDSFRPFGTVLKPVRDRITLSNEKVEHYNELGNMDTVGKDPVVSFFSSYRRDFLIDMMERHVQTAEIFFPVNGLGLMPFAPSLPDGSPDLEGVRVFICRPGQPFIGERGVWHLFPFPLEDRYDSYNICMRELIEEDLETTELSTPIRIVL